MKRLFALLLVAVVSLGMNCQGSGPAGSALNVDTDGDGLIDTRDNCHLVANPDQADSDGNKIGDACDPNYHPPVPDGAYGGLVVGRTTGSANGTTVGPFVTTGHRVVEIRNGALQNVRIAPDANGPFGCWIISVGSKQTVALMLGTLDGNQEQTITETSSAAAHYVVSFKVNTLLLTGEGDITLALQDDGSLAYQQVDSLAGNGMTYARESAGTLVRIGNNDTLPTPDGMNGLWINRFSNGGADGFEIRGLRVTTYYDDKGMQAVSSSQPVSSTTAPGSNVFVSFQATTTFTSDPTPRLYTITFHGTVQPDGTPAGQTTYTAASVADKVYNTTLERVPSNPC